MHRIPDPDPQHWVPATVPEEVAEQVVHDKLGYGGAAQLRRFQGCTERKNQKGGLSVLVLLRYCTINYKISETETIIYTIIQSLQVF